MQINPFSPMPIPTERGRSKVTSVFLDQNITRPQNNFFSGILTWTHGLISAGSEARPNIDMVVAGGKALAADAETTPPLSMWYTSFKSFPPTMMCKFKLRTHGQPTKQGRPRGHPTMLLRFGP